MASNERQNEADKGHSGAACAAVAAVGCYREGMQRGKKFAFKAVPKVSHADLCDGPKDQQTGSGQHQRGQQRLNEARSVSRSKLVIGQMLSPLIDGTNPQWMGKRYKILISKLGQSTWAMVRREIQFY
jgi:hypothetical protein